jgi:hypothetical protein
MWSMYLDRDRRRIFSDAAVDVSMSVSNYGLVAARLTAADYFEALRFVSRLAGSSNGAEIVKFSEAQYSAQAKAIREHTDNLFELGRGILVGATRPFRRHLITACCAIL